MKTITLKHYRSGKKSDVDPREIKQMFSGLRYQKVLHAHRHVVLHKHRRYLFLALLIALVISISILVLSLFMEAIVIP